MIQETASGTWLSINRDLTGARSLIGWFIQHCCIGQTSNYGKSNLQLHRFLPDCNPLQLPNFETTSALFNTCWWKDVFTMNGTNLQHLDTLTFSVASSCPLRKASRYCEASVGLIFLTTAFDGSEKNASTRRKQAASTAIQLKTIQTVMVGKLILRSRIGR